MGKVFLRCCLVLAAVFAFNGYLLADVQIAQNGVATAMLVLPDEPKLVETTSTNELADYLHKITGGNFQIIKESELGKNNESSIKSYIYIGNTKKSGKLDLSTTKFKPEEWVIRTNGNDLILAGGYPRGCVYAVYHLLEDVLGVRWWTPYEETVPHKKDISLGKLDMTGVPHFYYRDIHISSYTDDSGHFTAHSRLNRNGFYGQLLSKYGGRIEYGLPDFAHTFYKYFSNLEQAYKEHPDWFPLIDGKRKCDLEHKYTQLCLTNLELRKYFVKRLKEFIKSSNEKADKKEINRPVFYSIDQNDSLGGYCSCEKCKAIVDANGGSQAAPIIDFLNYISDEISEEYPDIKIITLAYEYSEKAPTKIKARDNIFVRLTDTTSSQIKPTTDKDNTVFRERLLAWNKVAKNLMLWDYGEVFCGGPIQNSGVGLPWPAQNTFGPDIKFFADHGIRGIFLEYEDGFVMQDMRDLNVWVISRLYEDPSRNPDELVKTFTDGYYGPAGKYIREYLDWRRDKAHQNGSFIDWFAKSSQFDFIDMEFVYKSNELFDKAEQAVEGDEVLLRRIHHARLPVDRAVLLRWPLLEKEWGESGKAQESFPLDRKKIAARFLEIWKTITKRRRSDDKLRLRPSSDETYKQAEQLVADTAKFKYVPLPEKFSKHKGNILDVPANQILYYRQFPSRLVKDESSEVAEVLKVVPGNKTPIEKSHWKLPLEFGLYDLNLRATQNLAYIPRFQIKGSRYQWYKLGKFKLNKSILLYCYGSWELQISPAAIVDKNDPNKLYEIWVQIKFDGPYYLDKNATCKENSISLARVCVIPVQSVNLQSKEY